MLTIVAPSRSIMSTSGTKLFASLVCGRRSSRHGIRSDFVASFNFPLSDIEGGDDWFSCWKKSSRSALPLVLELTMYKVQNKCRSRFMASSCSCVRVFALSGRHLNKDTLFLGIRSVTGVVRCTSRQLKNSLH